MIDLIGWIASLVVLSSMTFKTMWKLRLVNSIACVMWIFYGYLISNNPTIFVNFAILVTHIIWFNKNKIHGNQTPTSKG
jgi:uncharacterized protein with PQ loop repeat